MFSRIGLMICVKTLVVLQTILTGGCVATDLERQMRISLDAGAAAVVARHGKIVLELNGSGIAPILGALNGTPHVFENAVVMDRIVGRAAAAVYVVGKANKVIAPVMSEGAKKLLLDHGVKASAENVVPYIVNRRCTGMCPMDRATLDLEDPFAIVVRLREISGTVR